MVWFGWSADLEKDIWKIEKLVQMFECLARSTPGGVGGLMPGLQVWWFGVLVVWWFDVCGLVWFCFVT